jgi:hypothetical protein
LDRQYVIPLAVLHLVGERLSAKSPPNVPPSIAAGLSILALGQFAKDRAACLRGTALDSYNMGRAGSAQLLAE